uniref:Uncharacterized protein n=1 Tax=Physcomitrium patens TaxID=3218 RepID=A0A2K1ISS2_PHYPA|nr:hypothetical protein PHYPA_026453 [Physcomitrium patens]
MKNNDDQLLETPSRKEKKLQQLLPLPNYLNSTDLIVVVTSFLHMLIPGNLAAEIQNQCLLLSDQQEGKQWQ